MEGGKRDNKRKGNGFLGQFEAIKRQRGDSSEVLNDKVKVPMAETMVIGEQLGGSRFC